MKDLTIEAGSGLIVLYPMDISGGYTSVKEKTNMSLMATNICIHLSLSAISLMLNLQNQAFAALQFGNMIPLAPCTNFDRIWVSPKGLFDKFSYQLDLSIYHHYIFVLFFNFLLHTVFVGFNIWFCMHYAENVPGYNLTFWRPRAPSNYVILGDCVTSRYDSCYLHRWQYKNLPSFFKKKKNCILKFRR